MSELKWVSAARVTFHTTADQFYSLPFCAQRLLEPYCRERKTGKTASDPITMRFEMPRYIEEEAREMLARLEKTP